MEKKQNFVKLIVCQCAVLFAFVLMILACASSNSVGRTQTSESTSASDHANTTIVSIDSVQTVNSYDLAYEK